jgi:mono/diheme cytochrome c family protein
MRLPSIRAIASVLATSCLLVSAHAADVQAGKAVAQAKCGQCHAAGDWEGEDAPSLDSLMRDIVAGKVKHRTKLELTPTEIANIAAYWASGGK